MLSLTFYVQCATAQIGKIQGDVKDSNQKPIEGVVVSLLNAKDSSFVKAAISEIDGKFEFVAIKNGNYLLMATNIGYKKFLGKNFSFDQSDILVETIVMQDESQNLAEVKVVAKKPFVEKKIDRTIINPDALISNAGTTSLEILEKAPGIIVDVNGVISLKGKTGVVVFIDDKPTYLAASDLANYLRSLPSGSIETIEIMTNPPAKYDAAGNAGVINIKLKKNQIKGFNGGINLSFGQGRYSRTNNSLNLNYRVNKLNFFTNMSVNQNNTYQDLTINRLYFTPDGAYNSGFTQNSYIKRQMGSNNLKLGLDYYLSKKSTLGVVFTGFINPFYSPVTNRSKILDKNNEVTGLITATNPTERKWTNQSYNINYAYKIDSMGKELTTNLDYINYNSEMTQNLVNSTFTPDNKPLGQTTLFSSLPADINIRTAKIDYSNPLQKGGKFEAGVKSSLVNTDNTADFFDVIDNNRVPNYEFSNRFKYKENINAAYVNYNRDWARFSLQLGLRFENTNIKGNQLGNVQIKDSTFTRNYNNLFPTLYLSYKLDSADIHQLGFSFGRRIDRPDYQAMNPFTYPLDRFTYYGGNPFLKPTYSYNFELSHTYKNFLTTTLEYSYTKDLIQETNEQRGTIYYSRPGNFGKQIAYGINVNAGFNITKWWTLQLYTELKSLGFESIIYGQILDESRFYWFIGPNNQFKITKSLSAELSGNYQTRVLVAQFLTIPVWQMRGGLSYKILKDKGSIKLNVSDIFYTNQPGGDIRNIANSKANWLSLLDSRVVTFAFSYRFNKGKSLNARKSGGSESEQSRVRQN